jgi:uncharacterized membrane protein
MNKRLAPANPQPPEPGKPGRFLSWLYRNRFAILVLVLCAVLFAWICVYANTPENEVYTVVAPAVVNSIRSTQYYTGDATTENATGSQELEVTVTSGELERYQFTVDSSFGEISGSQYAAGDTIYLNVVLKDGEVSSVGVTTEAATSETALVYETAKVLKVLSDDSYQSASTENTYSGDQTLQIRLLTGQFKGQELEVTNYLGPLARSRVSAGELLTVEVTSAGGELVSVDVMDYNRLWVVLAVILAFILITVLVGRMTGLKSILGLILTIICLIFILVPLLLKGFDTVWTTFGMCAFIAVFCFTILGGIHRKTVCATLGTISGVAIAALFGAGAGALLRVNGYRMISDGVEALLNLRQSGTPIKLSGLLVGGIMIAALGAVMDVAMSISSAVNELAEVNPEMTRRALWRSAMNIGRDMVGTMTNTLILAFVGGAFIMIIYYYSIGTTIQQLLASYWFCVELVKGLASSVGVILSVPLTALISSTLYGRRSAARKAAAK